MKWETVPLRQLITPTSSRNRTDLPLLSVVREKGVVMRKLDKSDNHNAIPEDLSNYKVVLSGQFVINKMKAWQGSCGVSMYDGIVSPAYFVFALNIDNPRFFNYAIRSRHFVDEFNRISKGIRVGQWDLDLEKLKYVRFFLPPSDEQGQIVRYLDWKVSRINKLINAKRKQIALLQEQRRKAIDSFIGGVAGNEYRFRHLFVLNKGLGITKADLHDEGVPCVSYGEVHSKYGFEVNPDIHKLKCVDESYLSSSPKSLLGYGNFVFADTSEDVAGSGNFTYLNSHTKAFAGYHTIIARANKSINHRYFAYYFDSSLFRSQIQREVNGVKVYSITRSILNRSVARIPSDNDQLQLVSILDKQCSDIDRAMGLLRLELDLFVEYRTRLISDVVTGKLDVRGVDVPKIDLSANGSYMLDDTASYQECEEADCE
jgi:type I restriction enzyme S subunit